MLDKPPNPHGAEQTTKPRAVSLSRSSGNDAGTMFLGKKNHPRTVKIQEKGMKVWPEQALCQGGVPWPQAHSGGLSPFLTRSISLIITKGRTSERGRRNDLLLMQNR